MKALKYPAKQQEYHYTSKNGELIKAAFDLSPTLLKTTSCFGYLIDPIRTLRGIGPIVMFFSHLATMQPLPRGF